MSGGSYLLNLFYSLFSLLELDGAISRNSSSKPGLNEGHTIFTSSSSSNGSTSEISSSF